MNRYNYSSNYKRPHKFTEFSVGDMVRPTDEYRRTHFSPPLPPLKRAIITEINSNGYYLKWLDDPRDGFEDIYKADQIEHEPICACGHAKYRHDKVPGITHGECWGGPMSSNCGCMEFHE